MVVHTTTNYDVSVNCGNTFDDEGAPVYIVRNGNIFDVNNWVKAE